MGDSPLRRGCLPDCGKGPARRSWHMGDLLRSGVLAAVGHPVGREAEVPDEGHCDGARSLGTVGEAAGRFTSREALAYSSASRAAAP